MGIEPSKKEMVVATINYSGILLSPFEFYSQDLEEEETKISKCFKELLKEADKDFNQKEYKWGLGKIDQKLQSERYTPIYRKEAGIEDGKLIDEDTFKKKWDKEFELVKNKVEASENEIENAKRFDLHCYRSFIYHVYNEKDLKKLEGKDVNQYKKFMETFFSKSFLDEKKKIKQTFNAMESEKIDVLFLQEVSTDLLNALPQKQNFETIIGKDKGCAILLRKNKFHKVHDTAKVLENLNKDLRESINWNNDSVVAFADNFLFIGMHLSSKKEKNWDQIKKMTEDLKSLADAYPMCEIIVGGDANNFVPQNLVSPKFHSFPQEKESITTMKKRTWIQPQVNKADTLSAEVKDVLFSTLPLIKPRIVTILGVPSNKITYIPNQEHPCDHFVIAANIEVNFC